MLQVLSSYFRWLLFSCFFLFCLPILLLKVPAEAGLLSLRVNNSGVLEAVASDTQERDTKRAKKGETLICIWKLPDIESPEWPLKQRGIVYKKAYRRCWSSGEALDPDTPMFSDKGEHVIFTSREAGLRIMDSKGGFKRIPGFEVSVDGAGSTKSRLEVLPAYGGLLVLKSSKDSSLISSILDRWRSEIWWIPDLKSPDNSSIILSRSSDRVEILQALRPEGAALAAMLKKVVPEEDPSEGEKDEPELDWPWLKHAEAVKKSLESFEFSVGEINPSLFFLLNDKRMGKLVLGEQEMSLYPELDPYVFRNGILAFRLLDESGGIVLSAQGIYKLNLGTGHHEMIAEIPASRIKHLYPELALSPDHRYAAFRAWTSAWREEIFIVDIENRAVKSLVKGDMDLHFDPASGLTARFNPGIFNFSPDGLSIVALWKVLDSQEIRVYRLMDGELGSVPVKPEEPGEDQGAQGVSATTGAQSP